MAKIVAGEFYHDECWAEIAPRGVHPLTYHPNRHRTEEECAHCGEIITEEDD